MTAKEKALELYKRYCFAIATEFTDDGYFTNVIQAKQCALIAVDEIIDNVRTDYHDHQWYRQVKQEIEKL